MPDPIIPPPMTEEERRRCCLLGGCGCSSITSQVAALTDMLYDGSSDSESYLRHVANSILQHYDLVPKGVGKIAIDMIDSDKKIAELYEKAGFKHKQ